MIAAGWPLRRAMLALAGIAILFSMVMPFLRSRPTQEAAGWVVVKIGDVDDCALDIVSPAILEAALTDPSLASLPRLRGSVDPRGELRNSLRVHVIRSYHMIEISTEAKTGAEAKAIVGAVVAAYTKARGPSRVVVPWPVMVAIPPAEGYRWPIVGALTVGWAAIILFLVSLYRLRAKLRR